MQSLSILGVRVDDATMAEAIATISQFVEERGPRQVATVNPEFIMAAQANADFKQVLNEAALNVPDGIGLVWGGRLLRSPLRERVPGVELVEKLAELSAARGYSMFLLGGFGGVGEDCAAVLRQRFPGLAIAGTYEGHPQDPQAIEAVRRASPDILLVAYGHPKQDLWIHEHLAELNVPVAIGIGGAFDFIAGRVKRAPRWMQRLGLEWLSRLMHEPWRWRRMLALPQFAILVLLQRWKKS